MRSLHTYIYALLHYTVYVYRYCVYYYDDHQWEDLEAAEVREAIAAFKAHKEYEKKVSLWVYIVLRCVYGVFDIYAVAHTLRV